MLSFLRDSLYCGVEYGKYDLKRLLDTLTLDDGLRDGSYHLAIQEDGMHTVEALIIARYFMFTQVYFHDVRRAFDMVLGEFIGDCLEDEYGKRTYPLPDQISEYLKWDDSLILTKARELADKSKKNMAWRVIQRKHPKSIYSTMPHQSTVDDGIVKNMEAKCRERFPDVRFWLDRATDHPEKFKKDEMLIMLSGGGNPKSLTKESAVLQGLREIGQFRIYADVREDEGLEQEVTDYCRDFMR